MEVDEPVDDKGCLNKSQDNNNLQYLTINGFARIHKTPTDVEDILYLLTFSIKPEHLRDYLEIVNFICKNCIELTINGEPIVTTITDIDQIMTKILHVINKKTNNNPETIEVFTCVVQLIKNIDLEYFRDNSPNKCKINADDELTLLIGVQNFFTTYITFTNPKYIRNSTRHFVIYSILNILLRMFGNIELKEQNAEIITTDKIITHMIGMLIVDMATDRLGQYVFINPKGILHRVYNCLKTKHLLLRSTTKEMLNKQLLNRIPQDVAKYMPNIAYLNLGPKERVSCIIENMISAFNHQIHKEAKKSINSKSINETIWDMLEKANNKSEKEMFYTFEDLQKILIIIQECGQQLGFLQQNKEE